MTIILDINEQTVTQQDVTCTISTILNGSKIRLTKTGSAEVELSR